MIGTGGVIIIVYDYRCGGFRLVIIRCCGYIVKQIFTVIVFVIFPTGKCIAVMFGRSKEGRFIECCADLVLSRADHGTIHAVNKSYSKLCFFSRREFNIVFNVYVINSGRCDGNVTAGYRRLPFNINSIEMIIY